MMKVCINFGDIRCVVPVGDGSLAVRDVIDLAVERFRKATAKVSLLAKFTSKKDRAQSSVLGSRQIIKSTLCSSLCLPLDISSLSLHKLTLTNSLRKHDHFMSWCGTLFLSDSKCSIELFRRVLRSLSACFTTFCCLFACCRRRQKTVLVVCYQLMLSQCTTTPMNFEHRRVCPAVPAAQSMYLLTELLFVSLE